ncbi:cyclopropane fatty acyl phospholipid synthase [Desulfatirhabdium butyrativorans]|uniref:cyclopropane fatty acyl phospholipid synthase n=1 Tax=Desulfatirhabdium butyrativorans TaxID=340467 RepID=UPI00040670BD|nr:cyclopropane fatty acyl phospholipid synthase [Desulfatirhabdium butyrativorans]
MKDFKAMSANVIQQLLSQAGVSVNGENPWDPRIYTPHVYDRMLRDRNLGLGEAYMDGWWDCERLDQFFCRILNSDIEAKVTSDLRYLIRLLPAIIFNLQSRARSRIIARRHYDLGNDLFFSFLDGYRQYSCAYFQETDDLDRAQQIKMEMICRKLDLKPSDKVLDIGCGWGGLAKYMAERSGCSVTGVNISKEQLGYAREFCRGLPITFLDCDYRAVTGSFDKIVSVGMFEHVGCKNYRTFMRVVRRCLKPDGIFLLHTIGGNISQTSCDPWIDRYIFPNGMLPSIAQIARACEGLFVIEDWHNLGPHYDKTLMAWNANFQQNWPTLQSRYDERFRRMWTYYLLSCAGAFRARNIQVWQIVMSPVGASQPAWMTGGRSW